MSKYLLLPILLIAFGLRVHNLQTIPNGLFIDEAARGYDAYAIAQTGADMFGVWLPLFPRGFDDYTPALYTYLTVPFVWLLDLSRFSTRYAAVSIGLLTVAVGYQTIRHFIGKRAALIGAGLLAISPWYVLLSRIGTEWTLLGLGPMLTVLLAYRGLTRPRWLIAAGVVGGISLYGYAPVKAFLPLLLLTFGLCYRQALWRQRRVVLLAALLGLLLATPVYVFSFTQAGQTRYQEVSILHQHPPIELATQFVENYAAYFDPRFLFYADPDFLALLYIQRFKNVGLLYWFELPLILIGLYHCLRYRRRTTDFWLLWLLIAPLGINLHIHSPKPALWLTATPLLHGLAGVGLTVCLRGVEPSGWWRQRGQSDSGRFGFVRIAQTISLLLILLLAGWEVSRFGREMWQAFPHYSVTEVSWWAHGVEAGLRAVETRRDEFDSATVQPFTINDMNALAGIYYAFYTRYPPPLDEISESRLDGVRLGNLNGTLGEPGCHLALLPPTARYDLPLPRQTLTTYTRPDGQPNFVLMAIANPAASNPVRLADEAIFGQQILLRQAQILRHPPRNLADGGAICLLLEWQSAGNLPADYTAFVHLTGPPRPTDGSPLWSQHDGPPADGLRPTMSWQVGEPILDLHVLPLPATAVSGTYHLRVGLYESATGARLRLPNGADSVVVSEFDLD